MSNQRKLVVSIYDRTRRWVQPFINAGYPTLCWDYHYEGCILRKLNRLIASIDQAIEEENCIPYLLLSATPCTAFSVSGAQHWPKKDIPSDEFAPFHSFTEYHVALAEATFILLDHFQFSKWALENPAGRIEKLVPRLQGNRLLSFNPCDYGDPYTKRTIIWGSFNSNLKKRPVHPKLGSWMHSYGPSKNRAALRSATPRGFAKAFFEANK